MVYLIYIYIYLENIKKEKNRNHTQKKVVNMRLYEATKIIQVILSLLVNNMKKEVIF